jgi:hypothetical protein
VSEDVELERLRLVETYYPALNQRDKVGSMASKNVELVRSIYAA